MKIKKKEDAEKGICSECMRLFWAKVFNLLLNLQNIFRDLFKKKAILLRFQFSKFSAIYKTPIVILYRRPADTNRINIPKYSKRIYIIIHTPRWAFKLLGSLLTRSTSIFIYCIFSRRYVTVSVQSNIQYWQHSVPH